jgi:N-methylhydantoinase B
MSLEYDVIGAELHRRALDNITQEMAITLTRTSGSPIVVDARDFSTCLLDTTPEHVGFRANVLFHIASSLIGTEVVSGLLEEDGDLRPGDGWIVNDPHSAGAMHQGDVSVIMPTFYRDEHIGWSFANMHLLDVGGVGVSGFAPGARDVYGEGLLFPPIRIIREGAISKEWERFIASNVRAPGPVLNDIRSMIAANNTALRKLGEVVDEYGLERHREFCAINKDLTERLLRERIALIPDGVYETVEWNEFDGHDGPDRLLELNVQLEVKGTELRFAFSGVPQIDAFVNSPRGAVLGQTMTAVLTALAYGDLPVNGGFWRPMSFDLGAPGSIVNAVSPAPVSSAHSEVGMRVCKGTRNVLSQAMSLSDDPVIRSRISGEAQDGYPGSSLFGPNQHGGASVMFYIDSATGAGGGAQTVGDGQDSYGMTCMTGCGLPEVEVHEAADPVLFLWRRLVPTSGGPGQRRGGQGLEQAFAVRGGGPVGGPLFNACAAVPPSGVGGGYPASTGAVRVIRDTNVADLLTEGRLPTRAKLKGTSESPRAKQTHLSVAQDEVFVATSGGGGGLGDPLLRELGDVSADLTAGYVSVEHADAVYGVVLDTSGAVDEEATTARRQVLRQERLGGATTRDMGEPASIGVSVRQVADGWSCGYCDAHLADGGNWRSGDVSLREAPIADRFAELGLSVRRRAESPMVVLREYYCVSCAGVLGVDVATDESEPFPAPREA